MLKEILTVILLIYALIAIFWPIIVLALIIIYFIICVIEEFRGKRNCWNRGNDDWEEDEEEDYFLGFIEEEEDN